MFCQMAMADYERQWSEARGHQERHPLREKTRALAALLDQATTAEEFGRLLREGCDGADPILALLCQELAPRWNAAVHGGQGAPGRTTRS
ncbi:MAG TPA: hypothetical protein VEQ11_20490 [Chloroflexota bacterium]|nr:hypothetical protein [Chloroflexota bacterium]